MREAVGENFPGPATREGICQRQFPAPISAQGVYSQ